MDPYSSCGFYLNEYSAYVDITWEWPLVLYHRDYKTLKYSDTEYIVFESNYASAYPLA